MLSVAVLKDEGASGCLAVWQDPTCCSRKGYVAHAHPRCACGARSLWKLCVWTLAVCLQPCMRLA
jgi:hypothetical protein